MRFTRKKNNNAPPTQAVEIEGGAHVPCSPDALLIHYLLLHESVSTGDGLGRRDKYRGKPSRFGHEVTESRISQRTPVMYRRARQSSPVPSQPHASIESVRK